MIIFISIFMTIMICMTISLYTTIILRAVSLLIDEYRPWKGRPTRNTFLTIYNIILSAGILVYNIREVEMPVNVVSQDAIVKMILYVIAISAGLAILKTLKTARIMVNRSH